MSNVRTAIYAVGTPALYVPAEEASGNLADVAGGGAFTARGAPTYRRSSHLRGVGCAAGNFTRGVGVAVGDVSYAAGFFFRTTSADATATYAAAAIANVGLGDWSGSVGRAVGVHGGKFKAAHYQNPTAFKFATSTADVHDGIWHYGVVNYNAAADTLGLLVDGVAAVADTTGVGANHAGASWASIGSSYNGGTETNTADQFDGDLAHLAVWSGQLLTAAQALAIYRAGIREGVVTG